MKARIIKTGEIVEVYQTIAGWASENSDKIRVFQEYELDFDYYDWEVFRREAAKDILCSLALVKPSLEYIERIKLAIGWADELIKQLKEKRNERSVANER